MIDLIDSIVSSLITPDLRSYLQDLSKSNPDLFNFFVCVIAICGTRVLLDSLSKVKKNA